MQILIRRVGALWRPASHVALWGEPMNGHRPVALSLSVPAAVAVLLTLVLVLPTTAHHRSDYPPTPSAVTTPTPSTSTTTPVTPEPSPTLAVQTCADGGGCEDNGGWAQECPEEVTPDMWWC
jgi:hypothetical protein